MRKYPCSISPISIWTQIRCWTLVLHHGLRQHRNWCKYSTFILNPILTLLTLTFISNYRVLIQNNLISWLISNPSTTCLLTHDVIYKTVLSNPWAISPKPTQTSSTHPVSCTNTLDTGNWKVHKFIKTVSHKTSLFEMLVLIIIIFSISFGLNKEE